MRLSPEDLPSKALLNSVTSPLASPVWMPQVRAERSPTDLFAEKLVFWTIALVPLWWILGIQVFVYPVVGWYLLYRSFQRPSRVPLPFGWQMWCLYAGVWLLAIVINLWTGGAELGRSITATGSITGVWLLTVAVWYAVRRLNVRYRVIVRAICIVGICQLAVAGLGEIYKQLTGGIPETQSLLITLVPSMPADIFFEARLYNYEQLDWDAEPVTRLRSFYYWAPLAGTMSIFVCMGSWVERDRLLRWLSIAGGLITILLAAGRAAQVGIVLAAFITIWLGSREGRRALLWCAPVLGLASPIIISKLYDYFFNYRSDSTSGRLALYQETFQAFTRSPWIGFGAQGRSQVLDVPLGSHSQLYSTLYQTGLIGCFVLAVAWLAVSFSIYRLVRQQPSLSPTLGAWAGLSLAMLTGELAAASVTIFVFAAWLGGAWNWADQQVQQVPWSAATIVEPLTPWESFGRWWEGRG